MRDVIKIGAHPVQVRCVSDHEIERNKLGDVDTKLSQIRISDRLSRSRKNSVLLHEIIEWLNDDLVLEMNHNQISTLAETLYQVLADNSLFETGR